MTRKNRFAWLVILLVSTLSWAEDAPPAAKEKKFSFQDLLDQAGGSSADAPAMAGVRGLEETGAAVDTKARDFAAIERLKMIDRTIEDNHLSDPGQRLAERFSRGLHS